MKDIRGEKVVFGKGDFRSLDAMPSATAPDAVILHTPRRNWPRRLAKLFLLLFLFVGIAVGGLFVTLERGLLDATLTTEAESTLRQNLGDDFDAKVGAVRLRFLRNWMLGLEAQDVRVEHKSSGIRAFEADSIRTVLDPVALLRGKVVVAIAEIGRAQGNLTFLPKGAGIDPRLIRVDAVPAWLDTAYPVLERFADLLVSSGTETISASELTLRLPGLEQKPLSLFGARFSGADENRLSLAAGFRAGKLAPVVNAAISRDANGVTGFVLDVRGLATEPFLFKYSKKNGEPRYGLDGSLHVRLTSERGRALLVNADMANGRFVADGDTQPVQSLKAIAVYDFDRKKIEISDGLIDLGDTVVPFEGALIDLKADSASDDHGYAFEVVANDGMARSEYSGEPAEGFNGAASGFFKPATRELQLDRLGVITASGTFNSFLNVRFVEPSPAVVFTARTDRLSVRSVKQLWPFWFGKKARKWVEENITGGEISNGVIDISLAAGRIPEHPEPLVFREGELKIAFDAKDAELRYHPDLPVSSPTAGHFEMQDRQVAVRIDSGTMRLDSGQVLTGSAGEFTIDDISKKPLMGHLDLGVAGPARGAIDFVGLKPFASMARLPFAAADISGAFKGRVTATFGLDKVDHPPKPVWNAALKLSDVSLAKPFEGRKFSNFDGELTADGKAVTLDGRADIDGASLEVAVKEPLGADNKDGRSWKVSGTLDESELLKIVPSLKGIVSGKVKVELEQVKKGIQKVEAQLHGASVSVPMIGWRKGPGVPAKVSFTMDTKDGQARLDDFALQGDGFGARGNLTLDTKGLVSARFERVKLSAADNFSVSVTRKSGGNAIEVSGASVDARPFLDLVKVSAPKEGGTKDLSNNSIHVAVKQAQGYNQQSLQTVDLRLQTVDGRMTSVKLSAVTESGQALIINRDRANGVMEITSGDAGAVARFADLYRNMNGGLLNIKLKATGPDSWRGNIDIRNFALINETRLKSIVSARTGEDGRSLSDAVKADIDTSSQKFRRGFARLTLDRGRMEVENGVVRGDQVGATFQGTVRDASGHMNLTGTFMPAYGLNRLFAELPLIGVILGNGRDRGLLGITFRLEGPYQQPKLTVNPLSLIAPGVFRSIFEFE
ncbi:YhdP family protein [Rhizobium alvei]|uniref:DUF3971 domain-containing protein n=1 Tax=Rhizobium alvei TaxID=1132659 RepID=A0ABT8YHW4_9HYPH|nr:DUF3971 domain-containing protein [Rhizobium alvei]MDO6963156.1 DUF3971 domain-containing protein [Rhizobium alvei]